MNRTAILKTVVTIISVLFSSILFAQNVNVDGNTFLLGETQHDGVIVAFERVAPTVIYDTAYTNAAGYYSASIPSGVWKFAYHKTGFSSKYYYDTPFYSDQTIADTIMEPAIEGAIKDTLFTGTYIVTKDLFVNAGDTLVIEAGTNLVFANGSKLEASGLIVVNGEENNLVTFDWDGEGNYWGGIRLLGGGLNYSLRWFSLSHSGNQSLFASNNNVTIHGGSFLDCVGGAGVSLSAVNSVVKVNSTNFKRNISTVVGNKWPNNGGVINCYQGKLELTDCVITGNEVRDWCNGASIYSYQTKIEIRNSIFSDNIKNSTQSYEIDCARSSIKIVNSIIKESEIGKRSQILSMEYQTIEILNTIFIASYERSNEILFRIYNSSIELRNNVFYTLNFNPENINFANSGSNISEWVGDLVTENINGDSADGFGNLFMNPNLVDIYNSDFHPSATSPCINAGPLDTTGLGLPPSDIEGKQRVYGDIVDIGPYEYTGCTVIANVQTSNISCKGLNDGMAVADIYGGVPPFTLAWSTGKTTDTIENLVPGDYQLTVTDFAGCVSVKYFTISEPDSIEIGLQIFSASCGESNGSAVTFPSGGTLPYKYTWNGHSGSFGLTGVPAGTYQLRVSDKNGCVADSNLIVPGPDSLKVDIIKNDLTCYGSNDGYIALNSYGGSEPFRFQWTFGSTEDSISNLEEGVYNFRVTDASDCFTTGSVYINEPLEIKLAVDVQDATCGTNDGAATVVAYEGGEAPFSYAWDNGDISAKADSLPAGSYSVLFTDAKGCEAITTADINNINAPEITFANVHHVSCFGLQDGFIEAVVDKGADPYVYLWSNSEITSTISGLLAGSYTLTVSDTNNCVDMQTIVITQPEKLGAFLSVEHTSCGLAEGVISANVVGGTEPYSYEWSNGASHAIAFDLESGEYEVMISDANECTLKKSEIVSDVNGPFLELDSASSSACNNSNGYASVRISNGIPPYVYSWSHGVETTDRYLDNLSSGEYDVVVTDGAGCTHKISLLVETKPPDPPSICIVTVDSVTGMNQVVWEKSNLPGIEKYKVYKERYIAGYFELTGESGSEEYSSFTDEYANPRQRSWKYKISAVDECGNESAQSTFHETMHLTINASVNKDVNLIWNSYGGQSSSTYYINRYSRNLGWELIDSVPVGQYENKYTDFNPPPAHLTYYISYKIPGGGCSVSALKASNSILTQSISNMQESDVTVGYDIPIPGFENFTVYPNPFSEKLYLKYKGSDVGELIIVVRNALNQVIIKNEIQADALNVPFELKIPGPPGFYIIQLNTKEAILTRKILKVE